MSSSHHDGLFPLQSDCEQKSTRTSCGEVLEECQWRRGGEQQQRTDVQNNRAEFTAVGKWGNQFGVEVLKEKNIQGGQRNGSAASVPSTFQETEPHWAPRHQSMCLGGAEARGNLFIVS